MRNDIYYYTKVQELQEYEKSQGILNNFINSHYH